MTFETTFNSTEELKNDLFKRPGGGLPKFGLFTFRVLINRC